MNKKFISGIALIIGVVLTIALLNNNEIGS